MISAGGILSGGIRMLLANVDAIETPYKWAMLGRQPLEHWSVGRVSLLGDACHPTLPFLAQGANMAIEDGMVLARCLELFSDVPEALRHYEAARLERTSRIVLGSLENVSRYHNPHWRIRSRPRLSWIGNLHPGRWGRGTTGCMSMTRGRWRRE